MLLACTQALYTDTYAAGRHHHSFALPIMAFTMTDEAGPLTVRLHRPGDVQQAATEESMSPPKTVLEIDENVNENSEREDQELRSYVNDVYSGANSDLFAPRDSLLTAAAMVGCDRLFRPEMALSGYLWMLLILHIPSVNAITLSDKWKYLQGKKREAVSLFFVLIEPLGLLQIYATRKLSHSSYRRSNKWSSILVAAVAVQCTAVVTAIFSVQRPFIRHSSSYEII